MTYKSGTIRVMALILLLGKTALQYIYEKH